MMLFFTNDIQKCPSAYVLYLCDCHRRGISFKFLQKMCPFPGAEQEEDPEGDGTRPDHPPGRVHPGPGAEAAADAAVAARGAGPDAAPDGAGEPGGVRRAARTRTPQEARPGAAAAAPEPQGVSPDVSSAWATTNGS